ncbi:hypothetical protein H5J24_01870 [Chryseobacterium capnotolerans]|uniref:hypothetical protein n=1 Tax=Chryseobacterium capnotolerans TaxID=2759528 RepID=UPI001E4A622F|nr:hypothetical protein [Chryseobacterium capnotolerans]UHO38948.1 hypothetical protein H5J24_01870 [Chryseobacterium capnotolerans]
MKTKILLLFLFWTGVSFAQIQKDEILKEAEANIIKKGKEIDSINEKIKTLNKLLENATVNINQKISGIKEKLDLIEQSQMKMQEREIEIYQSNFFASLFSLHKINQDIDKLKLVNSTKKFYSKLKDVENPMRYPEFNTWLIDFKKYIEKKKKKEANLYLLDLIFKENSIGGLIGSSVPFLNSLTEGVASYINTLADENTNDIQKGQKMLAFILKLEKFSYGNINNNELLSDNRFMELKTLYNEILLSQLTLIGENKDDFLANRSGDPGGKSSILKV